MATWHRVGNEAELCNRAPLALGLSVVLELRSILFDRPRPSDRLTVRPPARLPATFTPH